MNRPRFSLHKARKRQECEFCGAIVPSGGEYWRAKGDPLYRGARLFCCMCHVLLGLPQDGWTEPPDGREVVAALDPESFGA